MDVGMAMSLNLMLKEVKLSAPCLPRGLSLDGRMH